MKELNPINIKYFKLVVPKIKKDSKNEVTGCCPVCGDTKYRLHLYSTEVGDLVHCFNSGCPLEEKHHSMYNFLKIINQYLEQYKQETFKTKIQNLNIQSIIDSVKPIEPIEPIKKEPEVPTIPLERLFDKIQDHQVALDYLKNRCIEPQNWFYSTQDFFKYNDKNYYLKNYILIPIFNSDYKYRGFYSRSINEKKFSTFLLQDTDKIWIQNPKDPPEIITEGIFDALSTGFNNPAAMLGADLNDDYIKTLPKNTIIATDNDTTGIKKLYKFIQKGFKVFIWPDVQEKDFNEMLCIGYTKQDIKLFIEKNTHSGLTARVKLGMKEC